MTTHVLMVIDASGSMEPYANDVRGGYASYLDDLVKAAFEKNLTFRISTTLFNHAMRALCDGVGPREVPRLDEFTYTPSGSTALLDAVGLTITRFEEKTKLTEDDRVIVFIHTDGEENASSQFTWRTIEKMLNERAARGWSIVYVGQTPDAWSQGTQFGTGTQSVKTTYAGTRSVYRGMSVATVDYAKSGDGTKSGLAIQSSPGVAPEEPVL